jgi:hypothetical protein
MLWDLIQVRFSKMTRVTTTAYSMFGSFPTTAGVRRFQHKPFLHQILSSVIGLQPIWNIISQGSRRRFMAPRSILNRPDFKCPFRFPWVSHSSRRQSSFSSSILRKKSHRRHPFSALIRPVRESIVCDNSLCFSVRTFMRIMRRIMPRILANGLPIAEKMRNSESSFQNRGLD